MQNMLGQFREKSYQAITQTGTDNQAYKLTQNIRTHRRLAVLQAATATTTATATATATTTTTTTPV